MPLRTNGSNRICVLPHIFRGRAIFWVSASWAWIISCQSLPSRTNGGGRDGDPSGGGGSPPRGPRQGGGQARQDGGPSQLLCHEDRADAASATTGRRYRYATDATTANSTATWAQAAQGCPCLEQRRWPTKTASPTRSHHQSGEDHSTDHLLDIRRPGNAESFSSSFRALTCRRQSATSGIVACCMRSQAQQSRHQSACERGARLSCARPTLFSLGIAG